MPTFRSARRIRQLVTLGLTFTACDETSVQYLLPPCVLPIALEITVSNANTHASIPGAFIVVGSGGSSQQSPCTQGAETVCIAPGGSGTYEVDIGAPGFQTIHRSVVVTGHTPKCGCESVDLQRLQVALQPTA